MSVLEQSNIPPS